MSAQLSLLDAPAAPAAPVGVWTDYPDDSPSIASYLREFDRPNVHSDTWPNLKAFRGIEARASVHVGQKCLIAEWHADRPDHLDFQAGGHVFVPCAWDVKANREKAPSARDEARAALRTMIANAEAWVAKPLVEVVAERIVVLEAQLALADIADTYEASQTRRRLAAEIADLRRIE